MNDKRSLALWRGEVAVESTQERRTVRRQFTRFLVLTSLGMFSGNLWILANATLRGSAEPLPA